MPRRSRWRGPAGLATAFLMLVTLAACAGAAGTSSGASESPIPSPTPVPGSLAPATQSATDPGTEATDAVEEPFAPPDAVCPAPPVAVEAPRLMASVGSASVLMNAGSSGVVTCSTSSSTDVIPVDPTDPLHVTAADDVIHVELPAGWHFLYWEGWDRPVGEEGANVTPGGRTPTRPASIDIPAPPRSGSSIVGVSAWVITADGRVVSGIEGTVLVIR